jgi:alkylation response protein AidB-like acyl-CoA dehydrogenase
MAQHEAQYELTDEQLMLRDVVRKLAKDKVAPGAADRDEKEEMSQDMIQLLRDNELLGIDFPAEYGGGGAGMISFIIAVEELAKVDASVSLLVADQELGTLPIILGGNEEQKKKYLPRLSSGEQFAAFNLTEPKSGSDVSSLACRAVKKGDEIFSMEARYLLPMAAWLISTPYTLLPILKRRGQKRQFFYC